MVNAGTLIAIIIIFAIIASFLFLKKRVSFLIAKKSVHITAISICAVSPYYVPSDILLLIAFSLTVINLIFTYFGLFRELNNNRRTWGVFYFSTIFTLLIYLFPNNPDFVFYPMIILALADGFAAIIGSSMGKHKYSLSGDVKSIEGSIVFFLFSVICIILAPKLLPVVALVVPIESALFISVFLTLLEAQSRKERDNFWIPLAALYWLLIDTSFIDLYYGGLIGLFSLVIYVIYKFRWLSAGGSVTTWLLGCILLISPNLVWVIPALVFLILGSAVSKLPQMDGQTEGMMDKLRTDSGGRTGQQVFCNGGIYTFLLGGYFISSDVVFLIAGMAAITTALSDTASSELGRRYGKATINVLNFKKIPAGVSGGISMVGTVAGLIFAGAMAGLPFLILPEYTIQMFVIVLVAGFMGNIADSFIGAIFQIKYRANPNSPWTDIPVGKERNQTKGIEWISNNTVNLMATATAGIIAFLGFSLF